MYFWPKINSQQKQQNKKVNVTMFGKAENQTRDLLHNSLKRYLSATESTESIGCSQAI